MIIHLSGLSTAALAQDGRERSIARDYVETESLLESEGTNPILDRTLAQGTNKGHAVRPADLGKAKKIQTNKKTEGKRAKAVTQEEVPVATQSSFTLGGRGGNFLGGITGFGLEGAYLFNPDQQMVIKGLYASNDLASRIEDTPSASIKKLDVNGLLLTGAYRQFFGDSFNMTLGLGYRKIEVEGLIALSTAGDELSFEATSSSVTVQLAIGNIWRWDNFYLGADWIGFGQPLTSSYESLVTGRGSASDAALLNTSLLAMEDLAKKFGSIGIAQLLLINLGIIF